MILVIGSGISSLAFAEKCRQEKKEFVVVEKLQRIGGKSITYKSLCGHAKFDIAGHFYHYQGSEPCVSGKTFNLPVRTRQAKVLFGGKVLDYPIQQAVKDSNIILGEAPKWTDYPQSSMTQFFVDRFGDLAWHFFIPYNRKLWAISTDLLEQDSYEKFRSPTQGSGYNDKFMYHDNGSQAVIDTLAFDLEKEKHIRCGHELLWIDPVAKVAGVRRNGLGGADFEVTYDKLISPLPLPDLCKITKGFESFGHGLRWSSVIVFNVCYKKKNTKFDGVSWLYVGTHKHRFFRCGWYSHVSPAMAHEGYESMYVEVSYPGEMDGLISIRDIQSEIVQDLIEIGIMDSVADISSIDQIVIPKAYPLSVNQKSERVETIKKAFESVGIYPVGRYGLWRWTGQHEDARYAEHLFEHLFNNKEKPKTYGV